MDAALYGLQFVRNELLLFAAFWIIVCSLDELAVDLRWLWLRATGRGRTRRLPAGIEMLPLGGKAAVFVAAWHEAEVIGAMVSHSLRAWTQPELRLYVGCYRNDPATLNAAVAAARGDARLRIVIHDRDGPTTKADCLNAVYAAMREDEQGMAAPYAWVMIQDAEDMVHPAALAVVDLGLRTADFVQLPVRAELPRGGHWIAGHYADEFAESHGKVMVVRDSLGAAIPAAGVGCAFSRQVLADLAEEQGGDPFATDCLTEDYELGLSVTRRGGTGRYLRLRDSRGDLVATRSYFPDSFAAAIRQKSRWIHGIAFQGWDRLGWSKRPVDWWMELRDRRGPLTAVVLAAAYLLIVVEGGIAAARLAGFAVEVPLSPLAHALLWACGVALAWRAGFRFLFTASQYGAAEGLRGVLRLPVANFIAIMAGRRALAAYVRALAGEAVVWDKTVHRLHPAAVAKADVA